MVARPPLKIAIAAMRVEDIPAVHAVERVSFPVPWPAYAFRQELETNRLARYLVARLDGEVVAYGGIWMMVDEAHVTTFAVVPEHRRSGVGSRLLLALLDLAVELTATVATLEVRISNTDARRLYERFGFRPVGVRPHYYSDNSEDALIMTTEELPSTAMQERLERLRAELTADEPQFGPWEPDGAA